MPTAFETYVNTELPTRIAIQTAPSADYYLRATGIARLVEARSPVQVCGDLPFFFGIFLESIDADVTSNGTTITLSLQKLGGGDLTMVFSDGQTILDCTPAKTIALTAGGAEPGKSFVYVPRATKALTESTTGWPTAEHIKIGYYLLKDAAYVQTHGPLSQQQIQDHVSDTVTGLGHLSHIAERLRASHALYHSGLDATITITPGTPDVVDLALSAGSAYQLHKQALAAFDTDTGGNIHVVNDSVTPYAIVTDLADLLTDASGDPMTNRYFNLVFWRAVSKTGTESHVFCNLPTGSYNQSADAQADVNGYDVLTVPSAFDLDGSVSIMLYRFTFRHQSSGGGDWTHVSTKDLRGQIPAVVVGGSTILAQTTFSDASFEVFDNGDDTKRLAFQLSGITAGNTRVLTVPDADGTLSLVGHAHAQYLLVDGTRAMTGDLNFDSYDILAPSAILGELNRPFLTFTKTNVAVNWITITNQSTGKPATITGTGEANAGLTIATSGTGSLSLSTDLVKISDDVQLTSGGSIVTTGDGNITLAPDGTGKTTTAKQIESTLATGTSPFAVASTTLVSNLNADRLDGAHVGTSGATIPLLSAANDWSGVQEMQTSTKVQFRDSGQYISSAVANTLNITAATTIGLLIGGLSKLSVSAAAVQMTPVIVANGGVNVGGTHSGGMGLFGLSNRNVNPTGKTPATLPNVRGTGGPQNAAGAKWVEEIIDGVSHWHVAWT